MSTMDVNSRLVYAVCAVFICLVYIPGQTDSSECVKVYQLSEETISEFQELRVNLSTLTQQLSTLTLKLTTDQDLIKAEKRKRVNATRRLNRVIDAERRQKIKLLEQLNHCLNSNESCDGCIEQSTLEITIDMNPPTYKQPTTKVNQLHCGPPTESDRWLAVGHKINKRINDIITRVQGANKTDMYEVGHTFRMSVVNDMLWLPDYENEIIRVRDPHTNNTPTEIVTPGILPNSVHQTGPTEVLLASKQGLYVLSTAGSVLYKVAGGEITDLSVACDMTTAYVYNKSSHHIVTVTYNGSRWVRMGSFSAGPSGRDSFNTIEVMSGFIYLCSHSNHTIHTYSLMGSHLATHGGQGSLPGQLDWPILCGTDSQGALLVCDTANDRLQVLSSGGGWEVYTLEGVKIPRDITVDTSGNLWVLWFDYDKHGIRIPISKYSV